MSKFEEVEINRSEYEGTIPVKSPIDGTVTDHHPYLHDIICDQSSCCHFSFISLYI
jgi:hypothetical protein